jgi:AraC-like DNA-binding protein
MMQKAGGRIGSIMAGCGFTDPAAFSRAFRQRFGLSPRDFLAQCAG